MKVLTGWAVIIALIGGFLIGYSKGRASLNMERVKVLLAAVKRLEDLKHSTATECDEHPYVDAEVKSEEISL